MQASITQPALEVSAVSFLALLFVSGLAKAFLVRHLRRNHRRMWQELGEPRAWGAQWSPGTHAALRDMVWKRPVREKLPDERARWLAAVERVSTIAALCAFAIGAVFYFIPRH